jgi:DNA excision repair protein ERCC-2
LVLIKRAISEAKKFGFSSLVNIFEKLANILIKLMPLNLDEALISKDDFLSKLNGIVDYMELLKECFSVADNIREEQKNSYIGSIANFLDAWLGGDDGFVRIISRKKGVSEDNIILSYRCLDPSIISKEVIENSFSTILMSGTLTPTSMYSQVLGFPSDSLSKEFPSPFPQENRLNLIVAKTSTKFTARSDEQFKSIAKVVTDIVNITPGNSAVFFPSYFIKDQVDRFLSGITKTVFHERQNMSKDEKDSMIESFRRYKKTGAVLLAVVSGSFGEGIDLPGEELKSVIVVGLPLSRPDLETKALIDYYDKKFNNGWNFGYVYPAFNKVIQNAGRCIRSASDKGVIVFLDERFTWTQYYRCFPTDWKMKVTVNEYVSKIKDFFVNHDYPIKEDVSKPSEKSSSSEDFFEDVPDYYSDPNDSSKNPFDKFE